MVRIKRHRNTRGRQGTKERRRKPYIPELVYKFLVAHGAIRDPGRASPTKCRRCSREELHGEEEEVVDSADSPRIAGGGGGGGGMGYRPRKDAGRISKCRGVVKRRPDLSISFLEKCVGGEGTRKARRYIKKALDFGVESGYLIPSDSTYSVLRVSSDLMRRESRGSKMSTCDRALSQERDTRDNRDTRDTPARLEDLQVQEQRRRRRRRRRRGRGRTRSRSDSRTRRRGRRGGRRRRRRRRSRRSRSRSRGRGRTRHGSPQNPEEVAEDEVDDYEMDEGDPKTGIRNDSVEREPKSGRTKTPDVEQSTKKAEENGSDLSVEDDETDDEEEKKRINATKS